MKVHAIIFTAFLATTDIFRLFTIESPLATTNRMTAEKFSIWSLNHNNINPLKVENVKFSKSWEQQLLSALNFEKYESINFSNFQQLKVRQKYDQLTN